MSNNIKINWDEIPLEYKWFAVDKNGKGFAYLKEPNIDPNSVVWNYDSSEGNCCYPYLNYSGSYENWKETLQHRPTSAATVIEDRGFEMSLQRVGDIVDLQVTGKLSKQQITRIMEIVYES
jgi:hypothetical protein